MIIDCYLNAKSNRLLPPSSNPMLYVTNPKQQKSITKVHFRIITGFFKSIKDNYYISLVLALTLRNSVIGFKSYK